MANNRLPFGLCKKYGIDLPKGATPREAWDALKEEVGIEYVEDSKPEAVNPADVLAAMEKREDNSQEAPNLLKVSRRKKSVKKPPIKLSRGEYAMVTHELATNLTDEEKQQDTIVRCIRNHKYTVRNNGFGNYTVIDKTSIKRRTREK